MQNLFKQRVHYKFFDRTFKGSSHIYLKKDTFAVNDEEIEYNKKLVLDDLKAEQLVVLKQIHGTKVHVISDKITFNEVREGDASVTNIPGIALGILTADCVPVLFYCAQSSVIGAAHCGWRSAKADIINNVVLEMKKLGAREIEAIIGPSIKQESYEVSEEYYNAFCDEDLANKKFFVSSNKVNHFLFDLAAYVQMKLEKSGIKNIVTNNDDTYCLPEKYFSYRRYCHGKDEYKGNLLSVIVLYNNVL